MHAGPKGTRFRIVQHSVLMSNAWLEGASFTKWGTSAKKKKRSCLKTNRAVTSLACPGVIFRLRSDRPLMVVLSIVNKQQQKNTCKITTAKNYAMHCWWTVLRPPCSLDRLIQPCTRYYTGAGRARHGSVCFEATSFFLFGESPSYKSLRRWFDDWYGH